MQKSPKGARRRSRVLLKALQKRPFRDWLRPSGGKECALCPLFRLATPKGGTATLSRLPSVSQSERQLSFACKEYIFIIRLKEYLLCLLTRRQRRRQLSNQH